MKCGKTLTKPQHRKIKIALSFYFFFFLSFFLPLAAHTITQKTICCIHSERKLTYIVDRRQETEISNWLHQPPTKLHFTEFNNWQADTRPHCSSDSRAVQWHTAAFPAPAQHLHASKDYMATSSFTSGFDLTSVGYMFTSQLRLPLLQSWPRNKGFYKAAEGSPLSLMAAQSRKACVAAAARLWIVFKHYKYVQGNQII